MQQLIGKTIKSVSSSVEHEQTNPDVMYDLVLVFEDGTKLHVIDMCCCMDHNGLLLKLTEK